MAPKVTMRFSCIWACSAGAGRRRRPKSCSPKKKKKAAPACAARTARMPYCTCTGGVYVPPSILRPGKVFCSSCAHRRNCPPVCHDWQNSILSVESMRSIAATPGPGPPLWTMGSTAGSGVGLTLADGENSRDMVCAEARRLTRSVVPRDNVVAREVHHFFRLVVQSFEERWPN